MANNKVAVTAGSGTNMATNSYTESAVTVHDEKVVLGEQGLASYAAVSLVFAVTSTATANSHLMQVMAGASLKVRIRRIEISQTVMATAAALMQVRLVRLTTAGTGGTAVTNQPLDNAVDGASGATSMILPSSKGTEAGIVGQGMPYMMQTIGASTPLINPIQVWDFDKLRSKPIIIPAGTTNGLAVQNVTAIAGGNVMVTVYFDEAAF